MTDHNTGAEAAPATMSPAITFHERPARKMTKQPLAKISTAVPRSGCLAISMTGTISRIAPMM